MLLHSTELFALETSDPATRRGTSKISAAGASPRPTRDPTGSHRCAIAGVLYIPAMSRGVGFVARFVDGKKLMDVKKSLVKNRFV